MTLFTTLPYLDTFIEIPFSDNDTYNTMNFYLFCQILILTWANWQTASCSVTIRSFTLLPSSPRLRVGTCTRANFYCLSTGLSTLTPFRPLGVTAINYDTESIVTQAIRLFSFVFGILSIYSFFTSFSYFHIKTTQTYA